MSSEDIHYNPKGAGIQEAAEEAVRMAKKTGKTITLDFNCHALAVNSKNTPEAIVSKYYKEIEDYRNSPEFKVRGVREAADVVLQQEHMKQHIDKLDIAIAGGLKALIPWVKKYAETNNIHVNYAGVVSKKLSAAGYQENEYVGKKNLLESNKEAFGRYIIGQVMANSPDAAIEWADDYAAMPDKPSAKAKGASTKKNDMK